MKRTIIKIDDVLCNGCGACITGCHEGALQLINNKVVMVSELYCDGLGACIGDCPVGAITLEEREAEPYDEKAVMARLIPKGEGVIRAHLNHLKEHGEEGLFRQGIEYLQQQGHPVPSGLQGEEPEKGVSGGCPGKITREWKDTLSVFPIGTISSPASIVQPSELRQFPVQLRLLNPHAGFLKDSHLLLAADCTAFACGDFHNRFLKGKKLAVACPKLDSDLPSYIEKLRQMIDEGGVHSLTVLIMEVPCCRGLVQVAELALSQASRQIPLYKVIISLDGKVKSEK